MNKNKIKKLDINLFKPEFTGKDIYEKARAKFIAEYKVYVESTEQYHPGFLFGHYTGTRGHYKIDPIQGEAKWNSLYPRGYDQWAGDQRKLSAYGEQQVIDKINEIIGKINPK